MVGLFLRLHGIFWISIPHLPNEVFKDIGYMPILLGRRFEEREVPSLRQIRDSAELDFSFVDEV
jgi:hypothetical protein